MSNDEQYKTQIRMVTQSIVGKISTASNFFQVRDAVADSITRLRQVESNLRQRKHGVESTSRFGSAGLKGFDRQRALQSRNDRVSAIDSLEQSAQSAIREVCETVRAKFLRHPTDHRDKSTAELLMSLADDAESFAQNLQQMAEFQNLVSESQAVVRNDSQQLRHQSNPSSADLVLMLAMVLRLASMLAKDQLK